MVVASNRIHALGGLGVVVVSGQEPVVTINMTAGEKSASGGFRVTLTRYEDRAEESAILHSGNRYSSYAR